MSSAPSRVTNDQINCKKKYYRLSSTCGASQSHQRSARGRTRLTTATTVSFKTVSAYNRFPSRIKSFFFFFTKGSLLLPKNLIDCLHEPTILFFIYGTIELPPHPYMTQSCVASIFAPRLFRVKAVSSSIRCHVQTRGQKLNILCA